MFVDNLERFGFNLGKVSIYLSIDKNYCSTNLRDFRLSTHLNQRLRNVIYITDDERRLLEKKLNPHLLVEHNTLQLFTGNGFSGLRNSALIQAALDGNDYIISIDDDEYPFIPIRAEAGRMEWVSADVFGPHIRALKTGVDISVGDYHGFQSPIPCWINNISKESRLVLGEMLSVGNEVLDPFLFLEGGNFKMLTKHELYGDSGRKNLLKGGNLGVSAESIMEGVLPCFYNPPGARGEDAFFQLSINQNIQIANVPSIIFHDPFFVYSDIVKYERFPNKELNVPLNCETNERFLLAIQGWLKYAPLYLQVVSEDKTAVESKIEHIYHCVERPLYELATYTNDYRYRNCAKLLGIFFQRVENDYTRLKFAQEYWAKLMKSNFRTKRSFQDRDELERTG